MMTTNDSTPKDAGQSTGQPIKNKWLNPRRKRFWFILVILVYTLLGFFAAPQIIRNQLTALLQDDLGRPASIGKIEVNPFYLSLRVQGFELEDTDGVKLAGFDEFYVNFQFLSLLKWAWTFSEIQLTGPYFHFERFDTGDTRLGKLLADFASIRPADPGDETGAEQDNAVPRLLIRNLGLNDGRVDFRDNVPETPVETQLSPINISIQELNTLPDVYGQQVVAIHLPQDASVKWSGSLALAPLNSQGELVLERAHLDQTAAYLEAILPLESVSAILSSRFKYHLRQDDDGELKLDINELAITLDEIAVTGLEPVTEFIKIQEISLLDGKLRYPEQSLYFGKLNITNPNLAAWLNEDGSLSAMDLVLETTGQQEDAGDTAPAGTELAWHLGIGDVQLDGGQLAFSDRTLQPKASIMLNDLRVRITGFNNEAGVLIPIDISGGLTAGGSYTIKGSLGILPEFSMSFSAATNDIPIALAQPYAQQFAHILIENGVIDSTLEVNVPTGQDFAVSGSIAIPALEVRDTVKDETLLSWKNLEIDEFDLKPATLHISTMDFEQLYGRFVINQDKSTNLSGLFIEHTGDNAAGEQDVESMDIIIGGIRVNDGSLDFSDFSLPLPFATHIEPLDGTISTIATNSSEPANIRMEGQVDEFGLARIEGSMDVFNPIRHTDVSVDFRNLQMSRLSPYTAQFAGREIDEGKLNLGLVYNIEEGLLNGANDIILSDLVLGDEVDHPDAANLPLGLAVSLLKNKDGVIDIDLPVTGDINDPEFKIGGVIWKAFTGMITKVVSAPFRLLGNLVGIDSENFGQFEFLAGRADLTPPELEKIASLQEALQQRPELKLEISGVTDPAIDVPAMKFIRLRDIANQRLEQDLDDQLDGSMMLDEEIRNVVVSLYTERFPESPPETLKPQHTVPPANDPEGKPVLDELAWATDLWNRLLAAEVISEQNLADLANTRAEAIRTAFLAGGQLDESRIVIIEPSEVESDDGEWVKMELGVASD